MNLEDCDRTVLEATMIIEAAAHAHLPAYRARLLAHRSVARAVDEARPYRKQFPPGAPNRD